jgi:pimeloyl-ACP methyl ester carboxylesterase
MMGWIGPIWEAFHALRRDPRPLGPIRVPTLYIWGDADDTVGRTAAEGTVDFVAAPYRFEVLPGVGHFAADQVPDRVSELLLQHVAVLV